MYIARAEGELALEEELWWALVSVYRQVVGSLGRVFHRWICGPSSASALASEGAFSLLPLNISWLCCAWLQASFRHV